MRTTAIVTVIAALVLQIEYSYADTPRPPRTFLFQTFGGYVEGCSALGPHWQRRISESLPLAKANTEGFLPAELWDALIQMSQRNQEKGRWEVRSADCDAFVEDLSDTRFRFNIRGDTAKALLAPGVYRCMLWFPNLADEIKQSWVGAFARNGFRLTEDEVSAGLDEWRSRGVKPAPPGDNQDPECREKIRSLEWEFDTLFSEQNITRILLDDLDRK